ncbi:hypothetical protein G7Y89_g8963 [Cudoniella acicularis]|uniref:Zn(2)-C6 fungal-type domain-containing protein n=1 Tax=Cudoniella acicularis TaxID=354080 RepID=A0A8H4RI77_9HELO|nr:hypothetical protein G7Y89_g8963 [Cudoniella acicularis]
MCTVLVPSLFNIIIFILSLLCILAGNSPSSLQNYPVLSVNTTGLKADFKSTHNVYLPVPDVYKIFIQTTCQGFYDNGYAGSPTNVSCNTPSSYSKFLLSDFIDSDLQGHSNETAKSLSISLFIDEIFSVVYNLDLHVAYIFLILGSIFTGIAMVFGLLAFCIGGFAPVVGFIARIASTFFFISAVIITVIYNKAVDLINFEGQDIGILAYTNGDLIGLTWSTCALSFVSSTLWVACEIVGVESITLLAYPALLHQFRIQTAKAPNFKSISRDRTPLLFWVSFLPRKTLRAMMLTPFQVSPTKSSKRKPHFKTKTGCLTCRRRRLKCDESKPACKKCVSAKFTCDGYDHTTTQKKLIFVRPIGTVEPTAFIQRPLSVITAPPDEIRGFDFFRSNNANLFARHMNAKFIGQDLLQMVHSEPVLWHAMLAMSSAFENLNNIVRPSNSPPKLRLRMALQHYNKAIYLLTKPASGKKLSMELTIVACLLFMYLEIMLGHENTATLHVESGTRIIRAWMANRSESQLKQGIGFTIVGQLISPLLDGIELQTIGQVDSDWSPPRHQPYRQHYLPKQLHFNTLFEARASFVLLMNEATNFTRICDFPGRQPDDATLLLQRQERLLHSLQEWSIAAQNLADPAGEDTYQLPLLRLYRVKLLILVSTALEIEETKFDRYTLPFEFILSGLESIIEGAKSYDRDTVIYLFVRSYTLLNLIALKCRNPTIRRRALRLWKQKSCPGTHLFIAVAERVIELEEEGFEDLKDSIGSIVPSEWARIQVSIIREYVAASALATTEASELVDNTKNLCERCKEID